MNLLTTNVAGNGWSLEVPVGPVVPVKDLLHQGVSVAMLPPDMLLQPRQTLLPILKNHIAVRNGALWFTLHLSLGVVLTLGTSITLGSIVFLFSILLCVRKDFDLFKSSSKSNDILIVGWSQDLSKLRVERGSDNNNDS